MAGDILVYVEHDGGQPKRISLEEVSKAAELVESGDGKVVAVALGAGAGQTVERLGRYGVDDVYASDLDTFDQYLAEPHAAALAQVVDAVQPAVILFPDTPDGRDVAARLAARLNSGMVANVVDVAPEDGRIDARETIFGGAYTTTVEPKNGPFAIYLVRPNAFAAVERPKSPSVHSIDYTPTPGVLRAKKGRTVQEEGAPTPLEEAAVIVAGGRGLGGPEPFEQLEELAEALEGVVAASRAAVDAGWISYPHQVGQTGRTVKPQLYFAIGISGAVQHRVGMQTAETIVAINRDADAPIFSLADLGVVGDLFSIVPALTQEVRRRKGE